MADEVSSLILKVDSTSAKTATRDLDNLTASSAKAEAAAGKLGTTSSTAARAVQEHGAATATAATQAAELAETEEQAAKRIHDMVQASLAAVEASKANTAASVAATRATSEGAAASKALADAQTAQMQRWTAMRAPVAEVQALLSKSKLTTAEVAKAEALLDAAQASGVITSGELAEAFAALDAAKVKDIAVTEAQAVANKTAGLNSRAQAEIATAASEVLSGNFGRLRRTGAAFANQAGLLTKLMSPMGLAFIGVSGAVIAYVSAMVQGEKETLAFTQALAKTGDLAGMTGSQLSAMALAVGSATGEFNDSTKAVLELAQAGFGASPALQGMAESAVRFGKATGDMKAGIEFATVAMGGSAKQIEDLDAKYNLLTASQANEVQYLFQIGEADKARQIVMRDGSAALAKRASEVEDSTGSIIKAWNAVTTAVSSAWHEMAHAGATDIESRLKAVNAQLASAQGVHMNASQQFVPNASPSVIASLKSTQAQLQAQLVQQGWDRTMQALDDARNKAAKGAQEWAATALAPIDELQSKLDIAVKMKEAFFAVPRTAAESARFMRSYNEQIAKAAQAYGGPSSTRGSGRASRDNSDKLRQMGVDDIRKQIEAQGRLNDEKARGDAIAAQFVATLHEQVAAQKNAIDIQVASVGMGQKEAERLRELNQLDQQRIQQVQRLQREQVTHPEQYAALQRQIDAVNASFGDMRDTMIDGFHRMDTAQGEWSNGFTSALQDFADQAADVAGQTHDLFLNAFNGMADGIGNFVQTGKFNLADFTRSFLADLAKMETRILISRILMQIFGGAVSYAGGTGAVTGMGAYSGFGASGTVIQTYNAAGNVFSGPGIAAYENQIVTRPTYFANGGNVMGEAGPEAIMPLSRGSDGKLGVKAQGSNVTVIVENHSDSKAEVSQSKDSNGNDILKVMIGAAVNEVNKQIGRGGSTGQVIQQTFGLSRRGVPVAG